MRHLDLFPGNRHLKAPSHNTPAIRPAFLINGSTGGHHALLHSCGFRRIRRRSKEGIDDVIDGGPSPRYKVGTVLEAVLGVVFIAAGALAARLPGCWVVIAMGAMAIGVALLLDSLTN